MFGPSTDLLREADVVICDTGGPEATTTVEKLLQPTTARLVHLPIAEPPMWRLDVHRSSRRSVL
jgi:hypothetical protein